MRLLDKILIILWLLWPIWSYVDLWLAENVLPPYPFDGYWHFMLKNMLELGLFTAGIWIGRKF